LKHRRNGEVELLSIEDAVAKVEALVGEALKR
jgi:hypothetical protein